MGDPGAGDSATITPAGAIVDGWRFTTNKVGLASVVLATSAFVTGSPTHDGTVVVAVELPDAEVTVKIVAPMMTPEVTRTTGSRILRRNTRLTVVEDIHPPHIVNSAGLSVYPVYVSIR